MRAAKLCLTVALVGFAAMVLGVHHTGRFFPWVHTFALLSGIALIWLAIRTEREAIALPLAVVVGTSVALRVFIYSRPASMIGMDPDTYAAGVNRVMKAGTVDVIAPEMPRYATLSLIYEFNSWVSIVAGLEGNAVLVGIPIVMGVILPLTATALARRAELPTNQSLAAGVLTAFLAAGILFSYWPVAQTMAVLVWATMLLLLAISLDTDNKWTSVGGIVCLPAAVIAHKISLLVPLLVVVGATIAFVFRGRLQSIVHGREAHRQSPDRLVFFTLLLGISLAVQWLFITLFLRSAILSQLLPLLSGGASITPNPPTFEAAVRGAGGARGILIRRLHLLALLPIVSLAGAWVWVRRRGTAVSLLVAAAAVPVALTAISIAGAGVAPPRRLILFGLPVFAVLVVLAADDVSESVPINAQTAILLIAIPLLVTQVAGAPLAPDYPDDDRAYLTQGEVDGKEFALQNSEQDVAMDFFYAQEQTDVASEESDISGWSDARPSGFVPLGDPLLNATLLEEGYDAILLRSDADVIRFSSGKFRLTWDPIETTDGEEEYNRFYDNGGSVGFARS